MADDPGYDPTFRPAFLDKDRAESIGYVSGEERPTFDNELPRSEDAPSLGLINRYREIARLHAMGKTNNDICEILGYTPAWMSTVLHDPYIQAEIARYRNQLFDRDITEKIKEMSRDGVNFLHSTILDPKQKSQLRSDNAKWAYEMTHGKAKQAVSVESGTLSSFMELLKDMKDRGEPLDVTSTLQPELLSGDTAEMPKTGQNDDWNAWISENIS